jgi:hypothetical protein
MRQQKIKLWLTGFTQRQDPVGGELMVRAVAEGKA